MSDAETESTEPAYRPSRLVRLELALDVHIELIAALTELLEVVVPAAKELDAPEHTLRAYNESVEMIPPNRRDDFLKLYEEHGVSGEDDVERSQLKMHAFFTELTRSYPEPWSLALLTGYFDAVKRQRRTEILYRSFVTSAVSSFEVLLSRVVSYFFASRPAALQGHADLAGGEKEFSLADLEQLDSIEEAREIAIAKRVEGFLFESFASWSDWFKKNLRFSFEDVALNWERLCEVIERRHIIVHNGGAVSRRYRANLGLKETDGPAIGFQFAHDEAYVRDALAELRVLATQLVILTWIQLDVEHAKRAVHLLREATYERLLAEDWCVAQALAGDGARLKLNDDDKLLFQINEWIALSRQDVDITAGLEALDDSALSPRFRLAKAALAGRTDAAFELLEEALRAYELTWRAVYEWPLLDPLRSDARYRQFLNVAHDALRDLDPDGYRPYAEGLLPREGGRYHTAACRYATEDAVPMPRRTALQLGVPFCGTCKP